MIEKTTFDPTRPRSAARALWLGIAFSLAFTALIAWAGPRLEAVKLLPDQGAAWYLWKLPEPTFWTRASVWSLYLGHQVALWVLIAHAQKNRPSYTTGLHKFNVLALGVNALFILLHFVQTHVLYDGLAQDVSVFSSQGSVIVLLVWVLLMENPRRGLFFGRKAPIGKEITSFARKYHGYFFAWATVYTFWFHPMVSTPGHLIGFVYMFLLLLQGSLFFTRVHVNRTLDLRSGGIGGGARHAGRRGAGRRAVADVPVRLHRDLRHHADARAGARLAGRGWPSSPRSPVRCCGFTPSAAGRS